MTFRAIPQGGPSPRQSWPLAGSRHLDFDEVETPSGVVPASALSLPDRDRLSAPRPSLCGLSLDRPRIMGILNLTPDSFSDGGEIDGPRAALARVRAWGADVDLIDIGGESTRPGATEIPEAEEIARVLPVIRALREGGVATPISIDTRKATVARAALDAGADMVNDVSALRFDPAMASLVAARGCPVVLMHSVATPETMQAQARYDDVVAEVFDHLAERIAFAQAAGIALERIVADPGIGFGKTVQHNVSLIRTLALYHDLGVPLLLGASRKRFIGTLGGGESAGDRMAGSLAVALHGAGQGTQILRVHDVTETARALRLWAALANEERAADPRGEGTG